MVTNPKAGAKAICLILLSAATRDSEGTLSAEKNRNPLTDSGCSSLVFNLPGKKSV